MPENEIMTLEEVASYLRVSERTVYDWAAKGEIPGGKIGTAWRFKRDDIVRWVDQRLAGSAPRKTISTPMANGLAPERVLISDATTKADVLRALIETFREAQQVRDIDDFSKEIFHRESLMSTGIGFGVGVPHVRLASISDLVMGIAVTRAPIADYESLDDEPVRIVCMIGANVNQHPTYIKALAAISKLLRDGPTRAAVLAAATPADVIHVLAGEVG